jgi:hypothetical protein
VSRGGALLAAALRVTSATPDSDKQEATESIVDCDKSGSRRLETSGIRSAETITGPQPDFVGQRRRL